MRGRGGAPLGRLDSFPLHYLGAASGGVRFRKQPHPLGSGSHSGPKPTVGGNSRRILSFGVGCGCVVQANMRRDCRILAILFWSSPGQCRRQRFTPRPGRSSAENGIAFLYNRLWIRCVPARAIQTAQPGSGSLAGDKRLGAEQRRDQKDTNGRIRAHSVWGCCSGCPPMGWAGIR